MDALLLGCIAGTVLFGYFVVRRMDRFFSYRGPDSAPPGRQKAELLVFGTPAELERIQAAGFRCLMADAFFLPENGCFSALLALCGDDAENLAMCRKMRRCDPEIYVIARSGTALLSEAYTAAGADRILLPGESLEGILNELRESEK